MIARLKTHGPMSVSLGPNNTATRPSRTEQREAVLSTTCALNNSSGDVAQPPAMTNSHSWRIQSSSVSASRDMRPYPTQCAGSTPGHTR